MLNGLFGLGRAYRKLPPHRNFAELAANVERVADHLRDKAVANFGKADRAPERWEWQLGSDLKMLVEYARAHVPDDADGFHHFSRRENRR